MQVALLSEVLHGPPAADDARRSAGVQPSGRFGDFAAVLAERQESASAAEKDVRVHDRALTVSRSSPDEPQVRAVRDDEDEPRIGETERNRAVPDEQDSSRDSKDAVETVWLAFSGMNRTERIAKGEDPAASESGIIATVAGAASKGGGAGQVAPVELGLEVAQSIAVPAAGVAALPSEEIANQFLLAMAGLADGADEGAAGLMRTLMASLQENKANVQNTVQPIPNTGSPAVTDLPDASPPALSQDTVDLAAWLKKLALVLSEEPSLNVSGEAALQPLQTEPLKSVSGGKDADVVDLRLLVSAAQNQDSVAPKASPVSPAVLDRLVLQVARSVAVPAAGVAALSSEEITNQFLLAMAGLTDGADEGAAGLMRTLTASLQENKANVQNTLQPLQTEPLKSVSGGKDADGADQRLLVSAAQSQDSVTPKASPVSPANAPENVTPAVLDKLVLQSVRYLVSRGEKSVTVQLSPPSLGELRIEVSSVKNTLNVSLLSGNPGVRDVLESHVLGLREALARSGIEVTHLAVLPALAGHAAGQQYAGQAQPDFTRMTPAVRFDAMPPAESGQTFGGLYRRAAPHDGTLNLFI